MTEGKGMEVAYSKSEEQARLEQALVARYERLQSQKVAPLDDKALVISTAAATRDRAIPAGDGRFDEMYARNLLGKFSGCDPQRLTNLARGVGTPNQDWVVGHSFSRHFDRHLSLLTRNIIERISINIDPNGNAL